MVDITVDIPLHIAIQECDLYLHSDLSQGQNDSQKQTLLYPLTKLLFKNRGNNILVRILIFSAVPVIKTLKKNMIIM